jgi:hypothetical protein
MFRFRGPAITLVGLMVACHGQRGSDTLGTLNPPTTSCDLG